MWVVKGENNYFVVSTKYLPHSVCYQHVSVSVSTIIRVTYKNITNSKICQNIQANYSVLQSMPQTSCTVNEYQFIY